MSGTTPATQAAAEAALATLAEQTLPGAAPLYARLQEAFWRGGIDTANGGETNEYTVVVVAVDRYLSAPT